VLRSSICTWALSVAAAIGLTACGPVTTAPGPTGSPSASLATVSPDARGLLSRPLKLPPVAAGAQCPVTPIANVSVGMGSPRGHGRFYLGGPLPNGAYAFNKMVYVVTGGATGPVLLRGGRLDGAGRLKFSGTPADRAEPAETLSTSGGSWAFYRAVIGSSDDGLYVYPSTKGCYAIQIDGSNFQDVLTISAS
jgi:hypothetical protein